MDKAEAYKIVFEDLSQFRMFRGHYDALHGTRAYMFGVLSVMEAISYNTRDLYAHDSFVSVFIENMLKSEEKANEAIKANDVI